MRLIKDFKSGGKSGRVSVICTDKNRNTHPEQMHTEKPYCPGKSEEGEELLWRLLFWPIMHQTRVGSPPSALYLGAKDAGFLPEQIRNSAERGEAFDSGRKRMSVWCLDRKNASEWIFAKVRWKSVLSACKTSMETTG